MSLLHEHSGEIGMEQRLLRVGVLALRGAIFYFQRQIVSQPPATE